MPMKALPRWRRKNLAKMAFTFVQSNLIENKLSLNEAKPWPRGRGGPRRRPVPLPLQLDVVTRRDRGGLQTGPWPPRSPTTPEWHERQPQITCATGLNNSLSLAFRVDTVHTQWSVKGGGLRDEIVKFSSRIWKFYLFSNSVHHKRGNCSLRSVNVNIWIVAVLSPDSAKNDCVFIRAEIMCGVWSAVLKYSKRGRKW